MIGPGTYPNFAFGWFELVANRNFLPRLLAEPEHQGWPILAQLLGDYLNFAHPLLQTYDAHESTRALYRGILRTLLVILHDCPEFFARYGRHLSLLMPPAVIQLRNTVLSATPIGPEGQPMTLPDPLSATVGTAFMCDTEVAPRLAEAAAQLSNNIRALADELQLQNGKSQQALNSLYSFCANVNHPHAIHGWGLGNLASLVTYLGLSTLCNLSEGSDLRSAVASSAVNEFIRFLCAEADQYGRYFVICALVDHLTYPCVSTSLFFTLVTQLFAEAQYEAIKEVITRVLLERLIVHRPHPWGVMVTFIELVKNPRYRFWELAFTRATPDIERVFEAISRSCLGGTIGANGVTK